MREALYRLLYALSLTLLGLSCPQFTSAQIQITGIDHYRLPPGEIITVAGSGLSNVTQARFVYNSGRVGSDSIAAAYSVNSTEAKVVMPDFLDPTGYHDLILETTTASSVCISAGALSEHTTNGIAENPYSYGTVIVRSGALLSGKVSFGRVIVERGGVFEMDSESRETTVYAQDGATVNVTSLGSQTNSTLFRSPDTVLIGDFPPLLNGGDNLFELPPIIPSYGLDYFQQGTPVNIEIIGNGSVQRSPDIEYFKYYGYATLTASPDPGYMFSGWSGDQISPDETIRVYINENAASLTATFSQGWLLEILEIPGVSVNASPELALYEDGQDVSLSANIESGYEFLGWGGDASGNELETTISIVSNTITFPMVRSTGYSELPNLQSADQYINAPGDIITVTGEHLGATTTAELVYLNTMTEMGIGELTSTTAKLVMPETENGRFRDYHLFLRSENGSSITIPPSYISHSSDGPLPDSSDTRPVVVEAGGTLTGSTAAHLVVVEAGGYYRINKDANCPEYIFAEDGAVVDFRESADRLSLNLLHSPETVILGDPPLYSNTQESVAELIPSLRVSHGFDSIQKGAPINLSIIGNGHVELNPNAQNYAYGTTVSIHAVPADGATFNSWSGDIISQNETITYTFAYEPLNLTANFSTGWHLDLPNLPEVDIIRSPDLSVYEDGQVVTLTAQPSTGYYIEGWAGDQSANSATIQITMDSNKRIMPILHPTDYEELPQLTSTPYPIVADADNVEVIGTNLVSAKTASLLSLAHKYDSSASNQTETSFEFQMPSLFYSKYQAHYLFLDAMNGATIGIPSFNEHTTVGTTSLSSHFSPMVIRAGAILTGFNRSELIVVESGGTLRVDDSMVQLKQIIAEDGAIIDFRGATSLNGAQYYFSPATLTLGTLPNNTSSRQYGSIRPSYGMDQIRLGYKVNIHVEGPGSVQLSPDLPAYAYLTPVNLIATPDVNVYFIRWTGDYSNIDATSEFSVTGDSNITAEFSTATNYFSVWRLEHFTNEELEDISISAFDADPDRDSITNAAEYAFGTDPRDSSKKYKIKVDKQKIDGEFEFTVSYPRPKGALDVTYQILVSKDLVTWNFNGDDTDLVYSEEISVESIDDDTEKVTSRLYPNDDSPRTFFVRISALLFD